MELNVRFNAVGVGAVRRHRGVFNSDVRIQDRLISAFEVLVGGSTVRPEPTGHSSLRGEDSFGDRSKRRIGQSN